MKAAYLELVPGFERASGHHVVTRWIPGVDLLKRVKQGETSDLVIMQAGDIDEIIKAGRIIAGSRVDLARSGVGVAVRAGAAKPDISSTAALTRALRAAKSVAYSTGPSGVYILKLFERLGIAAEIKAKSRQVKGEPVGAVVARGEAEIGFQQVSELLPVPGIDFLGPLPADIQQHSNFLGSRLRGNDESGELLQVAQSLKDRQRTVHRELARRRTECLRVARHHVAVEYARENMHFDILDARRYRAVGCLHRWRRGRVLIAPDDAHRLRHTVEFSNVIQQIGAVA